MKISSKNTSSQFFACLFTVVIAILSASAAHAQILLTIDDSHSDAVVITATVTNLSNSADATTTIDAYPIVNGIDLLGFFNPPTGFTNFTVTSSNLVTGNGSNPLAFNQADVDNYGGSDANLGIYFDDGLPSDTTQDSSTISFTSGVTAFTGTLTLNLTGYALPAANTTGTLQTGYNGLGGGPNTPIGEWEIATPVPTPEPATWALLMGSITLLAVMRRFRRA